MKNLIPLLPEPLRSKLNLKLQNQTAPSRILSWLNSRPEVQTLAAGRPFTASDLDDWRATGYATWESDQNLLAQIQDLSGDAAAISRSIPGGPAQHLASAVITQIALALHPAADDTLDLPADSDPGEIPAPADLTRDDLHQMISSLVPVRRGHHAALRHSLRREELESSVNTYKNDRAIYEKSVRESQSPSSEHPDGTHLTEEQRAAILSEMNSL